MVRKEAIDKEGVDQDDHHGKTTGKCDGLADRDGFVYGVRILKGDIIQGEVLMVRLDRVKDIESDHERAVKGFVVSTSIDTRHGGRWRKQVVACHSGRGGQRT